MGYQAPSLDDLRKVAADLEQGYKGDNPQRQSFILLLKQLTEHTSRSFPDSAKNILLGAIIHELEVINAEYRIPWLKRSTVDAKLFEKLNVSKHNRLGDDDRFVYMYALYSHLVLTSADKTTVANIRANLKTIRQRDIRFDKLIHAVPSVGAIQKHTTALCDDYRKILQVKNNPDRERLIKVIEYVHHASDYLYKDGYKEIPEMYELEQNARRGMILFALMNINSTYRILSPQGGYLTSGSNLFKEGLLALNIGKLDDISAAEKARLLQSLIDRIIKIEREYQCDPALQAYLKSKGVEELTDKEATAREITAFHAEQEKLKYEPSSVATAFSSLAGYATQSTAKTAMRRGVSNYAVKATLGMAAMSIGGPAGLIGLGALTCVGSMVGDGLVSSMTASLYTWLVEKLGSKMGAKAAGAFTSQYGITDDGINELRKQLSPDDEKQFCAWVNALLSVPLDVVTEVEKESIRHVFGLEKGTQLLPIEQSGNRLTNSRVLAS